MNYSNTSNTPARYAAPVCKTIQLSSQQTILEGSNGYGDPGKSGALGTTRRYDEDF